MHVDKREKIYRWKLISFYLINYRPISLLPIVSKITERLVHGQLMEYLIKNNKLAVHQSGNRKLHSTETALLYVTDQLLQAMDDKKVSIMVLLDMSKAFDSIRHDILLSRLFPGCVRLVPELPF